MSVMTIEQEVADVSQTRPHVMLVGAGISRAALPHGDRNGRPVPLLYEVAEALELVQYFPVDLKPLATNNFEAAYSHLFDRAASDDLERIDGLVRDYFAELELPDEPTLLESLLLSLRGKDVIATFNWDPFLMQALARLRRIGIPPDELPQLRFLHGNVAVGFCQEHPEARGFPMGACPDCGWPLRSTRLLYPVEHKDYQSDPFIRREWDAVRYFLERCSIFTVFGYSAPVTDAEAVELLKNGWGDVNDRVMEQTEVINRPGADHDELRETWSPFIHTHHYEIHDSFYDSFLAKHPRRSVEAYRNRFFKAEFISDNPVPQAFTSFEAMAEWFRPLLDAERASASSRGQG